MAKQMFKQVQGALPKALTTALVLLAGCHLIVPYDPADDAGPDVHGSDQQSPDLPRDLGLDRPGGEDLPDLLAPDQWVPDLLLPDLLVPDSKVAPDGGCPTGMTRCGKVCAKLDADFFHCGKCDNVCPAGAADSCVQGSCVCSKVGKACSDGLNCKGGACKCIVGGLCNGCCFGDKCFAAGSSVQTAKRCGLGGKTCQLCNDKNECTSESCTLGVCKSIAVPGTPCKIKTGLCDVKGDCCTGCRDPSGVCQGGNVVGACGTGGETCKGCSHTNQCRKVQCKSGKCEYPKKSTGTLCSGGVCASGSDKCCAGCVEGDLCRAGTGTTKCGGGGKTCTNCTSTNSCQVGSCKNGGCSHDFKANWTTCPGGRCISGNCCVDCIKNNVCLVQSYQNSSSCGTGGQICASCDPGLDCVAGACKCTSGSCKGCCNSAGTKCIDPQSDQACGINGGTCQDCTSGGTVKGECQKGTGICAVVGNTCNATLCPSGCCSTAGVCQTGKQDSLCGKGGEKCEDCSTSLTAGGCVKSNKCNPSTQKCTPTHLSNGTTCNGGKCCNGVCQGTYNCP